MSINNNEQNFQNDKNQMNAQNAWNAQNHGNAGICPHCGSMVTADSRFCTVCGTPVNREESFAAVQGKPARSGGHWKKVAIAVAAGVLVISVIAGLLVAAVSKKRRTVDISDCVRVYFEGNDGEGCAYAFLDPDETALAYGERHGRNMLDDYVAAVYIDQAVTLSVSPDEGLSNGEKVKVTAEIDKEAVKDDLGIILKCGSTEFEVEGLRTMEAFDPFEDIHLQMEGPDGLAKCSAEPAFGKGVLFFLIDGGEEIRSDYDGVQHVFSNGDTVTVTLSAAPDHFEDPKAVCKEMMLIPSRIETEIEVTGLEAAKTFDPFEDLTVSFDGINGKGTVTCKRNAWFPSFIYHFNVPAQGTVSNGDAVEVRLAAIEDSYGSFYTDDPESHLYDMYYHVFDRELPETFSKEYTASGLYVGSYDDLTDEQKQTVRDGRRQYFISHPDDAVPTNVQHVATYFLTANNEDASYQNMIFEVFSFWEDDLLMYYIGGVRDVIIGQDGTIHYEALSDSTFGYERHACPSHSNSKWSHDGCYLSLEVMHDEALACWTNYDMTKIE